MGGDSRYSKKRSGYLSGRRPSETRNRSSRFKRVRRPRAMAPRAPYRANAATAGFVGIEHKFYDTSLVAAPLISSTNASGGVHDPSAAILISTPAQGDGPSDRNGKKMVIESVYLTGFVEFLTGSSSAGITDPIVYVAIIQDTQTNAASMTSQLAFTNPSSNAFMSANPLKNLLRSTRFNTLKVWTVVPGNRSITSEALDNNTIMGNRVPIEFYKKVNIPVNFNGTGIDSNVANVSDNSLHVVAFCNVNGISTLSYQSRIRFVG